MKYQDFYRDVELIMKKYNSAFARRLVISHLVNTIDRPSVPALMQETGWPRRTIQDVIKAIPGLGIKIHFKQDGRRNNDGYYVIDNWGPFDPAWVGSHLKSLESSLKRQ